MSNWIDAIVQCPFYRRVTPCTIVCEGITPDTKLILSFDTGNRETDEEVKRYYMWRTCCRDYRQCAIYRMLCREYEEEQ